jgi:hypothetical protein
MTLIRNNQLHTVRRLTLWHYTAEYGGGSPILMTIRTTSIFNHYCRQNPAAQNDLFYYSGVNLERGFWRCQVRYLRNTDQGQLTLKLMQGTFNILTLASNLELYGSILDNQEHMFTFILTQTGAFVLQGEINSKNASSSGYGANIINIDLIRQGN